MFIDASKVERDSIIALVEADFIIEKDLKMVYKIGAVEHETCDHFCTVNNLYSEKETEYIYREVEEAVDKFLEILRH